MTKSYENRFKAFYIYCGLTSSNRSLLRHSLSVHLHSIVQNLFIIVKLKHIHKDANLTSFRFVGTICCTIYSYCVFHDSHFVFTCFRFYPRRHRHDTSRHSSFCATIRETKRILCTLTCSVGSND